MPVTVYKDASYQLQGLINQIERGAIGLPDIQRPFVWSNARVRDLFDSMYKGFPVGYLLFWATGAEAGTKKIGENDKQAAPTLLIVDGQQRYFLITVMTGTQIVRGLLESKNSSSFKLPKSGSKLPISYRSGQNSYPTLLKVSGGFQPM